MSRHYTGIALAFSFVVAFDLAAADPPIVRPPHPAAPAADRFITDREGRTLDLPAEDETFTFVVFGDRTGGPADGVKILAEAVADTNLYEPDLVMTVGDLVGGYNATDAWMGQMKEFRGIMDGLLCPWFPVAGNHDIYWRGPNRPEGEHEANYEMHFGPLWYAFDHKDRRFIVLYTDEANPDTGEHNFGKAECQRMSPEQLAWLKATLASGKDKKDVFVFLHHPRWIGGRYGDDWERIHPVLADAGNVRAVFAGHIHRMRYDGPRDGIEYVTLATVGGGQSNLVPEAGYLHQFHHVTVRPDGIALACIPVGETMDVRDITGTVSDETGTLARTSPSVTGGLSIDEAGNGEGTIGILLTNPTGRPVEFTLVPESLDGRWGFAPDHAHATLAAGESRRFDFEGIRSEGGRNDAWSSPTITLDADYLAPNRRYAIPTRTVNVPIRAELPAPAQPDTDHALDLDGAGQAVRVEPDAYVLPNGPFTLEAWFEADSLKARVGLVTRTEGSEFGLFLMKGVPSFWVHLDGAYASADATGAGVSIGEWHHVAGVYDGSKVRLYLDGTLVAQSDAGSTRTRNTLPLMIGADVDANGRPTSTFHGRIDEVRLSSVARYAGESIEPERRHESDDQTVLLFHFDAMQGPWLFDDSGSKAHGTLRGTPRIVPAAN
ncbi:MAG: metallophosphoesterase [Phycisphaerales bacterium]|nr:metallophosphoesterase [Phycisphaerales bacterium]